jgi:hypothetical protein
MVSGRPACWVQFEFGPKKRKRPDSLESSDARLNSPPPKSAQELIYVESLRSGMARTGDVMGLSGRSATTGRVDARFQ